MSPAEINDFSQVLHNKVSCLGTPKSFDAGVYVIEDLEMETEGKSLLPKHNKSSSSEYYKIKQAEIPHLVIPSTYR